MRSLETEGRAGLVGGFWPEGFGAAIAAPCSWFEGRQGSCPVSLWATWQSALTSSPATWLRQLRLLASPLTHSGPGGF